MIPVGSATSLTPMGRALLEGFADNIDQMVIPFPDETAAAIKQALATIDAVRDSLTAALRGAQQYAEQRDGAESRVAELKVERDGAVKRALMVLDAKNHWADRARALEAAIAMHSLCPTCGGINAHTLPCAYYEVLRAALAGLPVGKP